MEYVTMIRYPMSIHVFASQQHKWFLKANDEK